MPYFLRAAMIALLVLSVASCASRREPEATDPPSAGLTTAMEGQYRIGVDDRVQVSVWRNPELSVTVPVRPDGMISIPLIGDVLVGGSTPTEVADKIKLRLNAFIRDPNVAVILVDLRSTEFLTRVRVTGAVRGARSMNFRQGMTVLDAVLEAGGVNDFAAPNRTKVYRKQKDKTEVIDVALGDILAKGKLETNVVLRPGDVVTVPERLF